MVVITIITTTYLIYTGYTYYNTSLAERFYHPHHNWFKPSGIYGQGLGILGTFMIVFGVFIYIARKRYRFLAKYIVNLKYLLEFHIFLCTLGSILILFHTAFKFGGIVSIAFWCMVSIVLSGFIGLYIYRQIPKTIQGRTLSLNEVRNMKTDLVNVLSDDFKLNEDKVELLMDNINENNTNTSIRKIRKILRNFGLPKDRRKSILKMVKKDKNLTRKIARLDKMKIIFKFWHIIHLPFALIMLVIVSIHIAVTIAFGYKWIF